MSADTSGEILIFTAINEEEKAEDMLVDLLESGLIISGTIFPSVKLFYRWNDKINIDEEVKILIKAKEFYYTEIEAYILKHHHYLSPELVKLDATFGSKFFKDEIKKKIEKNKE